MEESGASALSALGDMSLTPLSFLDRSAAVWAQRPAVRDGERAWSYSEHAERVGRLAASLRSELRVADGERVATLLPNVSAMLELHYAVPGAGGVLVPLNTRFKGGEAAWILSRSEARALFTVGEFLGQDYLKMLEAESLPSLETRVVFDGERVNALGWNAFLAEGERVSASDALLRASAVQPDDLADLLFTSGTTGKPKGVMCAHAQTLRAVHFAGIGFDLARQNPQ